MDYKNYILSRKEWLLCLCEGLAAGTLAAWILYQSVWGLVLVVLFVPLCVKREKKKRSEQRKEALLLEFRDAMQSVTAALQAGYSMENAWRESEKEMTELYGNDSLFVTELHQINQAVGMNQPIEKLLYEFALRSDCEDIQNFSDVFLFAKRSGGDFPKIISTTIEQISDKIEVEREVQTVISAKKMEQKIMNVIPIFIILYLNLTSGEFLQPLYGNFFGICVMTAALGAYLLAIKLSEKMTNIKV
jgi:tight adherence protein B